MQLPTLQSDSYTLQLLQTKWASILNPVLRNPTTNPTILQGVSLVTGVNVINTGMSEVLQGWMISDLTAGVTVYRSAPKSSKTLTLTSSGAATCDLVIF